MFPALGEQGTASICTASTYGKHVGPTWGTHMWDPLGKTWWPKVKILWKRVYLAQLSPKISAGNSNCIAFSSWQRWCLVREAEPINLVITGFTIFVFTSPASPCDLPFGCLTYRQHPTLPPVVISMLLFSLSFAFGSLEMFPFPWIWEIIAARAVIKNSSCFVSRWSGFELFLAFLVSAWALPAPCFCPEPSVQGRKGVCNHIPLLQLLSKCPFFLRGLGGKLPISVFVAVFKWFHHLLTYSPKSTCLPVCMCMHVHVYVSLLYLASRTPDSCSLSVWFPITIFPAVFLLHSLCAAKLHCMAQYNEIPVVFFVLIVIVCPKSMHMVTKGDKALCLLCLRLLAGGSGEGNGGQQSALCFKMSDLRQHKPVLLTFGKFRSDLEFKGCGERRRCKAKSLDCIKCKNICHLPTLVSLCCSLPPSLHWTHEASCVWKDQFCPPEHIQTRGSCSFLVWWCCFFFFFNPCLLSDQALDVSAWHPHPLTNSRRSEFWCHVNTTMKVRIKFLLGRSVDAQINIARHEKVRSRSVLMCCSPASYDAEGQLMLLRYLWSSLCSHAGQVNVPEKV